MSNVLEPRTFPGILIETFKIYGKNFIRLLVIAAIVQVPLFIAIQVTKSLARLIIAAIGARLLFTVAQAFLGGALIHAVSEQYLRQTIHIGRAYRFAWGRLWALAGVLILLLLVGVLVGMLSKIHPFLWLICFLPATYFVVRWALALPAALLEGLGPIDALSRSSELVKGDWWRVLATLLVLLLIMLLMQICLLESPSQPPSLYFVSLVFIEFVGASFILTLKSKIAFITVAILGHPIFIIGVTLLYYDSRVWKEEYNLDSLAKELHIIKRGSGHGVEGDVGSKVI